MPARQPFTQLCQAITQPASRGRADLHLHTTHSDGLYTPAQIVCLANRAGLMAIAITDHDTLAGVAPARLAAPPGLEVITGVEITCELDRKEIHLLAYDVDAEDEGLVAALDSLREGRRHRFRAMIEQLRGLGVRLPDDEVERLAANDSVGRRNLAELLVKLRQVDSVRSAFQKYLGDHARVRVPKSRLPAADAIRLTHEAGGVVSWAHPTYEGCKEMLTTLVSLGLDAVEVDFPNCKATRGRHLREWAREWNLAISAGSDCHGPAGQTVGACTLGDHDLRVLRGSAT